MKPLKISGIVAECEKVAAYGYNVKEYLERSFADAVNAITDYTQYDPAVMSLATR